MTVPTPSSSRSNQNHTRIHQDRGDSARDHILTSPSRGSPATETALYTTVDNLILPGVIGATVEGPKTPLRSPKTRRSYNYFGSNNNNNNSEPNGYHNNVDMSSYASPHTPKKNHSSSLRQSCETLLHRDDDGLSRYVDTEVPLQPAFGSDRHRYNNNNDNNNNSSNSNSDDIDDRDDGRHPGYVTPRVGKRYRENFRPHDTPIAPFKRHFSININNINNNNNDQSSSNDRRSNGHASHLHQSSPRRNMGRHGSYSGSSEEEDEHADEEETERDHRHLLARILPRGASQEAAQRVPVSLELEMDQEASPQNLEDNYGNPYGHSRLSHHNTADYEDHDAEEGLDIGNYEDELYPLERLRSHSYEANDIEDDIEDFDEEAMAVELEREAAEQKKEQEQLGFIKRWASLLRKQRDEFGWGTPKRPADYQTNSDSDSGRSFTSARVRKGPFGRQRSARPRPSQTMPSLAIPRTPSPVTNRTPSRVSKNDSFNVPLMKQLDSGIGGSQDSHDEERAVNNEVEASDRDQYRPLQRVTSSEKWEREDYDTGEPAYQFEFESEDDRSDHGDSVNDIAQDPSVVKNLPSNTQQSGRRRRMLVVRDRRQRSRSFPQRQRVYPWHVVWRMVQGYCLTVEGFIRSSIITLQFWFWTALAWIRFAVEWPWSQKYKARNTVESWIEAGVNSGLLSPGTLFGVAVLILTLWGGHSLGLGNISTDQMVPKSQRDCSNDTVLPSPTRGGLRDMLTSAWARFSWSNHDDTKEQQGQNVSWREWVPHVPSVDLWIPFRDQNKKPASSTDRIQIPTDQIQSFEELESRIKLIQKALDDLGRADDQLGRKFQTKFDDLSDWVSVVERDLNRVSEDVKSLKAYVQEGGWIEQTIKLIHDEIPSQLVVSRDPQTGNLSIPNEFWDTAKDLFMTSEQVQKLVHDQIALEEHEPSDQQESSSGRWGWKSSRSSDKKSGKVARWEDYLQENERAMAMFVEDRMSLVSKGVFLKLVKEEANQIWQGVEKKVMDLLEKQGKLQGMNAPSRFGHRGSSTAESNSNNNNGRALTDVEHELISGLIDEALEKYSADAIAKPDYALFTAGGRILTGLTSPTFDGGAVDGKTGFFNRVTRWTAGWAAGYLGRDMLQRKSIEPEMHPGNCWPMNGTDGQLAIRLAREIVVTEVTIEHADSRIVSNMTSAPREIEIWSLRGREKVSQEPSGSKEAGTSTTAESDTGKKEDTQQERGSTASAGTSAWWREGVPWPGSTLLTTIEYEAKVTRPQDSTGHDDGDQESSLARKPKARQTFSIPLSKQTTPSIGVALRIKSNWGDPRYTCVYRVRIHGYEPEVQKSLL
ncbi:hypothetical protein BGX28_004319 [Mortierella sp. GBA30]|nr:hypothetical protein BGX28_004319 [Mortierella sp. GBA30]